MSARINWRACFWMAVLAAFIVALGLIAPDLAHAKTPSVSKADLRVYLTDAAAHYHLSATKTDWIVRTGLKVAWRESRYHTRTGHREGCFGVFQFQHFTHRHPHGWSLRWHSPGHAHADWRECPRCSAYRFVKVMHDGGKAAIRRHWRASSGGAS